MPQAPLQANVAVNQTTLKSVPLQSDQSGNLLVGNGSLNKYNITAAGAVVKATPGRICKITVQTASTGGTFSVNDCATVGAAAIGNQILGFAAAWPAVGTVINLDWPCTTGIVVIPGTAGVVSVSFD
jgi:hypothetical protein